MRLSNALAEAPGMRAFIFFCRPCVLASFARVRSRLLQLVSVVSRLPGHWGLDLP